MYIYIFTPDKHFFLPKPDILSSGNDFEKQIIFYQGLSFLASILLMEYIFHLLNKKQTVQSRSSNNLHPW